MVRFLIDKIVGSGRMFKLRLKLYRHGMRPNPGSIWFDKYLNKLYITSRYRMPESRKEK